MAGLLVIEVPMGFLQQILAQVASPNELHHQEEGVLGPGLFGFSRENRSFERWSAGAFRGEGERVTSEIT